MAKKKTGSSKKPAKSPAKSIKKSTKSTKNLAKEVAVSDDNNAEGTQTPEDSNLGTLTGKIESHDPVRGTIKLSDVVLDFKLSGNTAGVAFENIGDRDEVELRGIVLEFKRIKDSSGTAWRLRVGDKIEDDVSTVIDAVSIDTGKVDKTLSIQSPKRDVSSEPIPNGLVTRIIRRFDTGVITPIGGKAEVKVDFGRDNVHPKSQFDTLADNFDKNIETPVIYEAEDNDPTAAKTVRLS